VNIEEFLNRLGSEESGGNANARNPDSGAFGTYQFMDFAAWAREAGLDPNDKSAANQRAVAKFKAQQYYDQFGDWGAVAVAWYAGPNAAKDWLENSDSPRFNDKQGGGKYPSINEYAMKVLGTDAPGAATSGSTDVTAASAQAPNSSESVLPSDARVVIIDGKFPVVLFDVGGGLFIKFNLSNPYQFKSTGNVEQMTSAQFNALGTIVHGGDAAELAGLGTEGKTFRSQYDFVLTSILGDENNPANKDPEVRQLIAEISADESLLDAPNYIQNRLRQTNYWQGTTEQARRFADLSDADKQTEIQKYAEQILSDYTRYVGIAPPDIKHSDIWKWAYEVAAGVRGAGAVLFENIMPLARQTEGSPLQRSEQEEHHAELQHGNDVENQTQKLRALYARWGVPVTDSTLRTKAQGIVEGTLSDADVLSSIQGIAKTMYPWKDPNIETADAAQPWIDTYTRIMEKPSSGIFDGTIQKALTHGTPLWQFEQELKSSDEWLNTDNARNDMVNAVSTMGKVMGFV
jgi:hypothetical protein